jgi:hypothetical protein
MVVMQALVAAGLGVATQTGLALRAHRIEGVVATELPGWERHIYAATYGEPPDSPATAAVLATLAEAAASATSSAVTSSGQSLPGAPRPAPPRPRQAEPHRHPRRPEQAIGAERPRGVP